MCPFYLCLRHAAEQASTLQDAEQRGKKRENLSYGQKYCRFGEHDYMRQVIRFEISIVTYDFRNNLENVYSSSYSSVFDKTKQFKFGCLHLYVPSTTLNNAGWRLWICILILIRQMFLTHWCIFHHISCNLSVAKCRWVVIDVFYIHIKTQFPVQLFTSPFTIDVKLDLWIKWS